MGTRRRILVIGGALVAVLLAAAVGAWGWLHLAPRRVPAGQPPLQTIQPDSLATFRAAFNDGADRVRVLAMLSPT